MNIKAVEEKNNDPRDDALNENLAAILSKIAAMQSFAIPKYRFSMASLNQNNLKLKDLSLELRAKELWLVAFPFGQVVEVKGVLDRPGLPALWISQDRQSIKIIKGLLGTGLFLCEDHSSQTSTLSQEEMRQGRIFSLTAKADQKSGQVKSAKDWFFYAIKKRKAPFLEAMIASVVVSVLALVVSFYTMQVYDRVVPTQSYSTLLVITIGALIAMAIELITKEIRSITIDKACKQIDAELSGVFFGQMLSIRMDARPNSVGTFASQIKQFEFVRNFMTSSTLFVLADIPFVIFFIIIIWVVGGALALVPLSLLPLSIIMGLYAKFKLSNLAHEQLEEANRRNGLLVESIDGIESIKAVGGEWKMQELWKNLTAESAEKELKIRSVTSMATSATQTVQQLSYVLMIAAGAYAIGSGKITMGALMACSIISNRALSPIAQIAGKIVQWQHAKAALENLDQIMKLPTDRSSIAQMIIPGHFNGALRAEEVNFGYEGSRLAIANVNLKINPGDRIAIIGAVGSGKSTLIKLLSGLYKPSKGKIFLDEIDMSHIDPEYLRESIGYLTQDVRLFNGSLKYNLTLGLPSPSDSQILEACTKTGLIGLIKNHPKGLDLEIYEGGRGLSGGQKQLVGLTRMMIAKPKVLLLDEPTASMDNDLESRIIKTLFDEAKSDSIIILSTHKLTLLPFVNRIIVVDKSKLVMDGPRQEVINKLNELSSKHNKASQAKPGQTEGV
jgi:ATP-binding cassette subfamily C protein LapB